MANVNDLARALSDVHLNNLIEECVVTFDDGKAYIKAMDLTSSLFVQTSAEIDHEDGQCGIANLALFGKYLNLIKDIDVTIKQKENILTVKPAKGSTVKYLLAEVDLIPSYNDEWDDNILEEELEKFTGKMSLTQESVSDFLQVMGLFAPNSVYFEVSKKGLVTLHGGRETEHQFEVKLGKIKDVDPCTVKVYGKHLTPILSALDFKDDTELFLTEGEAIIISTTQTSWMLQPTSDE